MTGEPGGSAPLALDHTRQITIDALCEHFANDVMSVEEFERRVDGAHNAASAEELRALLQDLPGTSNLPAAPGRPTAPAHTRDYSVTTSDRVKERSFAVAVMGGTRRAGRWSPARNNHVIAIMGGAEIDFREAVMGPGVTEVQIFTLWGGVEVIVPPGMNVESHGIGIMGGFEHAPDRMPDPNAPTLRVTGLALMGGVEVTVRQAGESARDARRRRRQERRDKARELREGSGELPKGRRSLRSRIRGRLDD
ncbi:MAG TPA: DUF1707 domain-containing protein [Longimicrobiales bacterium]|nr:DUF1707 domain-containing protein [Longimicrobiales bacterium]